MNTDGYTVFTGPMKHGPKGNQAIKNAEKHGEQIDVVKKFDHANKKTLDGKHIAKIMNDEDDHKPPTMPHDLKIAIAQARQSKGWNQEQFAKKIEVPKQEVNSWEAGKTVPPGVMIARMDKVLGIKLPRPNKH